MLNSSSVTGTTAEPADGRDRRVAVDGHAGLGQRRDRAWAANSAAIASWTSSVSAELQTDTRWALEFTRIFSARVLVGGGVDVHVADAHARLDDRHRRLLDHAR